MRNILTIARLTWMEARRRRVAAAAAICGVLFLAVFATTVYFVAARGAGQPAPPPYLVMTIRVFLTLAGLYVVNFLTIALAVLLPVDTLSGEIDSGVIQTLAAKPIHRAEIVLGKWFAYAALTGVYLVLMSGGVVLIMKLLMGYTQPRLWLAVPSMWLGALTLLTVCIAGGARFSTVTNGLVAFAFYGVAFIGGWVEHFTIMTGAFTARYVSTAISLVSPSDAMWRLAAHHLQPSILNQLQGSPFTSASTPSTAMVIWAVGYIAVGLIVAVRVFQRRTL